MVRRSQVGVLLVVVSGVFSVLLAVAVNVATGGQLPGPLAPYGWAAWPAVGLLAVTATGLALWQHRLAGPSTVDSPGRLSRPAELPAAPALFGMVEDLAAVERVLAGGASVVVIAAAPGTGKTSLALRVAHDARPRYPDGQLYAALRGATSDPVPPEVVLARFLGALGRPDDERRGTVEELAARFRSAVADRKLLVLLDDARDEAQVEPLLPGGRDCLTVVTSRRLLADLPGAAMLPIGGLRPNEALALLAATAGEERIAADLDGARRIVAACAGLPLAIRIVGGRLRARSGWTPSALAARLVDEGRRLDELRLGDRAVRSTFRTAYEELSELDRLVFRRAGAHPGQVFGLGTAAARCGLDTATVGAALDRLADAFLVEVPAPDRYRLHDLIRLFALETFEAQETPADRTACLVRQLDWLGGFAASGRWLAEDRDYVLSVLRAALAAGEAERAWSLVAAVHPLLTAVDDHPYRLRLWQAGEAAATALRDDRRRVRALRWISHSYGIAGQVQRALPPAEEAVALAEQLDDPEETAQSARRLGEALRALSRFDAAEAALTRALELFVELGRVEEEIEVRAALGVLYNNFWRHEDSTPMFERARDLLPTQETIVHGWVMLGLGLAHKFAGRRAEAAQLIGQAFGIARRLGNDHLLGYCFQERAWLVEQGGRDAEAERDFREMLAIFERIRHGSGVGAAHEGLGVLAEKQARHEDALAHFDAAIDRYDRLGDRVRAGELRLRRSATRHALGREAEAVRDREEAERLIGDTPIRREPGLLARLPVRPSTEPQAQ